MEYKDILSISRCTRQVLESLEKSEHTISTRCFNCFPRGCCKISAVLLMQYFKQYHGVEDEHLYLLANAKIEERGMKGVHAWAKIFNWHIDITGDQFEKEPVIVRLETPWPNCVEGPDEYIFTGVAPDFEKEILFLCEKIKNCMERL